MHGGDNNELFGVDDQRVQTQEVIQYYALPWILLILLLDTCSGYQNAKINMYQLVDEKDITNALHYKGNNNGKHDRVFFMTKKDFDQNICQTNAQKATTDTNATSIKPETTPTATTTKAASTGIVSDEKVDSVTITGAETDQKMIDTFSSSKTHVHFRCIKNTSISLHYHSQG